MKTLGNRISVFAALLSALVVNFFGIQSVEASIWVTNGSMITARYGHTATLLSNGKVLVTGGGYNAGHFSSTELYDPVTATWTATGLMAANRVSHTATLLSNGKVLVAGGLSNSGSANSPNNRVELYDPATRRWSVTGAMAIARYSHTATLLPNGKVLVAGGNKGGSFDSSAELYDPATGTWASAGVMSAARSQHTATLLPNGRVLVAGGVGLSSAELYDPASGTWMPTGSMIGSRRLHTATLLPNGKVFVVGGISSSSEIVSSSEIYDPATGTWTAVGAMATGRYNHTATLLPNGNVLVVGGNSGTSIFTASTELYRPDTGLWNSAGVMSLARGWHSATLLSDGRLLVAGGQNRIGNSVEATLSTELFVKAPGTVTLGNLLQTYDGKPKNVAVTTIPPDLIVAVTYNGSIDAPINPGNYTVIGTIYDPDYQGSVTNMLVVGIRPVIQTQPASRTNNLCTTATFMVMADGTPTLSFQWRKEGINLSNSNGNILMLTNIQKSDEGLYSVAISNAFGGVISADARLTVNLPPVADATATLPMVISANGFNATVILDGSRSREPDGDSLQYTWFNSDSTNVLTNGIVAVVFLPMGTNSITLAVSDGMATDSQTITVEVLTPTQTINRLIDAVREATAKKSFLVTLRAALDAINRGNSPKVAIILLRAFQHQVKIHMLPVDPVTAQALIGEAQFIIDAMSDGTKTPGKVKIIIKPNGKSHLNFAGVPGKRYIIEASSDFVNWEKIGVVNDQANGDFIFDDDNAPNTSARFYRVVVP